jgi:thiamine-phosphate pyrophosphorylase
MRRMQVVRRAPVDGARRPSHLPLMARAPTVPDRPPCAIYLITPPTISDLADFAAALGEALDAAPVAALQIRLKDLDDAAVLEAISILKPVAHARGVAVILNDRPDLAARSGCDGVHLGQSDAPLAQARRILGPDAMIGVTCHDSRELAMEAAEAGADYVAFGAFFPTDTKATVHRPDPEILTIWQETVEIPCVAIGGITAATAGTLARAGADFVALSAAVWSHPEGPAQAVRELDRALAAAA